MGSITSRPNYKPNPVEPEPLHPVDQFWQRVDYAIDRRLAQHKEKKSPSNIIKLRDGLAAQIRKEHLEGANARELAQKHNLKYWVITDLLENNTYHDPDYKPPTAADEVNQA